MHGTMRLEFGPNGEWWDESESDMTSALAGYDNSTSKLMHTAQKQWKYRQQLILFDMRGYYTSIEKEAHV